MGKSDSGEFSEKWRENFSHHPSWCDADMALQQINAVILDFFMKNIEVPQKIWFYTLGYLKNFYKKL